MRRRFAEETTVPISKSRQEVDKLLRNWGCDGIQWTDEFSAGRVTLRFTWPHQGATYRARLTLLLFTDKDTCVTKRSTQARAPSCRRCMNRLREGRGRQEHRVLALWVKAALNAVDAGLMAAEALFLPFLEDIEERTVVEVVGPQMHELLKNSATKLLGGRIDG